MRDLRQGFSSRFGADPLGKTSARPIRVVVPDDYPPLFSDSAAYTRLKRNAMLQTEVYTTPIADESHLIQRIEQAHTVLGIRSSTLFTATVLEACRNLRHIAVWGTATDHVSADTARSLDIVVSNTPGATADAVAEHALSLALALAHRVTELDQRVRDGEWPRGILTQLSGKTLGVVGTGSVARRIARIGKGIGMRILVTSAHLRANGNQTVDWEPPAGAEFVGFEDLLTQSDVISLHTRLSSSATKLFGREEFAMMKPNALFINTARSKLVDEHALAEALSNQTISGAGLDVFESEPLDSRSPLKHLPNVILSPHTAALTTETLSVSLNMAIDNVLDFLAGKLEREVICS